MTFCILGIPLILAIWVLKHLQGQKMVDVRHPGRSFYFDNMIEST